MVTFKRKDIWHNTDVSRVLLVFLKLPRWFYRAIFLALLFSHLICFWHWTFITLQLCLNYSSKIAQVARLKKKLQGFKKWPAFFQFLNIKLLQQVQAQSGILSNHWMTLSASPQSMMFRFCFRHQTANNRKVCRSIIHLWRWWIEGLSSPLWLHKLSVVLFTACIWELNHSRNVSFYM